MLNLCVGSPELTASKFRHCPKHRGLHHRLPIWAWLLVAVGAMLLLLLILGGVLAFIRNMKKGPSQGKNSATETRRTDEPGNHQINFIFKIHKEKSVSFYNWK